MCDEARLEVLSDRRVWFRGQYVECDGCPDRDVWNGSGDGRATLLSRWAFRYAVHDDPRARPLCRGVLSLGGGGVYRLNVTEGVCSPLEVRVAPEEPWLAPLVAVVAVALAATAWYGAKAARGRSARRGDEAPLVGAAAEATADAVAVRRSRSVDAFRGLTVALMIFVNYGGGCYSAFRHAPWNGLTAADLVFPWFAWLMGLSLCLSVRSRLRDGTGRRAALAQVARRGATLIAIGVVLNSDGTPPARLRIPGVLQRLGLTYLLVGVPECLFADPSDNYHSGGTRRPALFRDARSAARQWCWTAMLTAAHSCVTHLLPVPGCPTGYVGPGGLHADSSAPGCTGGAAARIDESAFGRDHMYGGGSFRRLYGSTSPFDPEGLLGTLTCALVAQLGCQAARTLLAFPRARSRLVRWIAWGAVTGSVAGGLCSFSRNSGLVPVNKNLWSPSYALATSSSAFLILAILYAVVDVYPVWQGRPFYYAGRNALFLYVGHVLMKDRFPFNWKMRDASQIQLLFLNLWAVVLWLFVATYLHRKNIIITV